MYELKITFETEQELLAYLAGRQNTPQPVEQRQQPQQPQQPQPQQPQQPQQTQLTQQTQQPTKT